MLAVINPYKIRRQPYGCFSLKELSLCLSVPGLFFNSHSSRHILISGPWLIYRHNPYLLHPDLSFVCCWGQRSSEQLEQHQRKKVVSIDGGKSSSRFQVPPNRRRAHHVLSDPETFECQLHVKNHCRC